MTNLIIAIMGILLTAGLIVLAWKQHLLDEELEIIESKESTADLEAKVERLLSITEKLADDYALIEEQQKQDRRDLIDVKKRYILFREPSNGAGVSWAKDYPCNEDEGEDNG